MTELPSDKASTGDFPVTSDLRSRLAALKTTPSGVAAEAIANARQINLRAIETFLGSD
jgi:hypothetical protein